MRKIGLLGLLLAVLGAASGQAQVASPELIPAAPRMYSAIYNSLPTLSIVPDNPAVMQWSPYSLVAAGRLKGSETHSALGDAAVEGGFHGARWTGEWLAIAGERMDHHADYDTTPLEIGMGSTSYGISGRPLQWLSIGGSREELVQRTDQFGSKEKITFDSNTYGVSVILGESFFLGAARSSEDYSIEPYTGPADKGGRDTRMYGIGYRSLGEWKLRAEFTRYFADGFEADDGSPQGFGMNLGVGSLEIGWHEVVVGYSKYSGDSTGGSGTSGIALDGSTIDVGYVPERGFAVSFRRESSTLENPGAPLTVDDDIDSLAVSYLW